MDISAEVIWLVLALVAGGIEMMTGTVFLLAVALGLAAAALAAWVGLSLSLQLSVLAAVVFVGSMLVLLWRRRAQHDARATDPDIGRVVEVSEVAADGTATVQYRGAPWKARAVTGALTPGRWRITALDGPALLLEPLAQ